MEDILRGTLCFKGERGFSAYEVAVRNGFEGTVDEWLKMCGVSEDVTNMLNAKISGLASGSPLVASSISDMKDTTHIYVNTTDGNWYYYKGTEWTIGGVYQATRIADESIFGNMLDNSIETILEKFDYVKTDIHNSTPATNESVNSVGDINTYTGWFTTDYIKVLNSWKKIKIVDFPEFYNPGQNLIVPAITFYDSNKNFIGYINRTSVGITQIDDVMYPNSDNRAYFGLQGVVDVPENAKYMRVAKFNNDDITSSNVMYFLNNDEPILDILDRDVKNNIKSVLCIGDSLTEGDYGSDPEGTKNVQSENYPYFLSEYLGCEVDNQGVCGITALRYWNERLKNIDFTKNYDVVLIMLGTNSALTDTIDTDTNITEEQTYEDYANTQTGRYCSIIEYVMEKTNNKSQIILCTAPHVGTKRPNNRNNAINSNEPIKKIGKKYALPVIDMLYEAGFNDYNEDVFQSIDTLHFNKKGYQKMATFIGSKIKSLFSYFE